MNNHSEPIIILYNLNLQNILSIKKIKESGLHNISVKYDEKNDVIDIIDDNRKSQKYACISCDIKYSRIINEIIAGIDYANKNYSNCSGYIVIDAQYGGLSINKIQKNVNRLKCNFKNHKLLFLNFVSNFIFFSFCHVKFGYFNRYLHLIAIPRNVSKASLSMLDKSYRTFIYNIFFKLYYNIYKYSLSSFMCAIVDLSLFYFLNMLFGSTANGILASTVLARLTSGSTNFALNKYWVFKSKNYINKELYKYIGLFCFQMISSWIFVTLLGNFSIPLLFTKIFVDMMLFIMSYFIQKKYIFNDKKEIEHL